MGSGEFQPYVYRSRLPRGSLLTSIVHVGMDPNATDEGRDLALRLLNDRELMTSRKILGHTAQAARRMIEEMRDDVVSLNDPLALYLPDVEIIEP